MGRLVQVVAGILALHFALGTAIRAGAKSNTNRGDYRDRDCVCREDDAVLLSSVGGMDQRHTRSMAGNMPLDFEYQCFSG